METQQYEDDPLYGMIARDLLSKPHMGTQEQRVRVAGRIVGLAYDPESRERKEKAERAEGEAFVRSGKIGPNLRRAEKRDMSEAGFPVSLATGGAIFVPQGSLFETDVDSAMLATSEIFGLALILDTPQHGRPVQYPADMDISVVGEQVGENQQLTDADVGTPSLTTLGAFKFSAKGIRISRELLEDSPIDWSAYLANIFGRRLARVLNPLILDGGGASANTINGFLNGTQITTITAVGSSENDGSGAANSIGTTDLANLEAAVDPSYRRGDSVRMMMSSATLEALRKTLDKYGSQLYPTLNDDPPRLLGYRVSLNAAMDSLQSGPSSPQVSRKVIVFADFSRLAIRRGPALLIRSHERFGEYDQIFFAYWARYDSAWVDTGANAAILQTTY